MPTKRTRRSHTMLAQVSSVHLSILSEGLWPMPEGCEDEVTEWQFLAPANKNKILEQSKQLILDEWIRERPGTRPAWWWKKFAPEKARRRLGGIGDTASEHLAYVESYEYGIPALFVNEWEMNYFNGRARDIHGNRIGTEFHEGDFKARAVDPSNPPRYETQAAYLRRHNLLTPEEKRRLEVEEPAVIEP